MSYQDGRRTYQNLGVIPLNLVLDKPTIGRWWDPSTWADPFDITDFTADAENLARQWILLNRRGNAILPPAERQELQLVADEYDRFMREEVREIGSGWYFISDDRKKLNNFKRQYDEWYKRVGRADPELESHVVPPVISIGPPETYDDRGLLTKGWESATGKIEDLLKSKYTLPALGIGAVFLGFIWLTARSGVRSGVRRRYDYR